MDKVAFISLSPGFIVVHVGRLFERNSICTIDYTEKGDDHVVLCALVIDFRAFLDTPTERSWLLNRSTKPGY